MFKMALALSGARPVNPAGRPPGIRFPLYRLVFSRSSTPAPKPGRRGALHLLERRHNHHIPGCGLHG